MNISFSEAEYREGYRLGKPCLVYLRDENVPILPKFVERDPEKVALFEKFRNTLQARHTIAIFKDSHDLSVSVAADLSRTAQAIEETTRIKDVEGKSAASFSQEINDIVADALNRGIAESSVISTVRQAIATLLRTEKVRRPLVFFSYSHKDQEIVRSVAAGLKNEGIDVWIDFQDIGFGERITESISRGLDSADFLAYFMSPSSLNSVWSREELNVIMSRRLSGRGGATILPILLESVEIPALLRDVHYLDLRDKDVSKVVKQLSKAIKYHLQGRKREE
jgi:hypothetical protein